MGAHPSTGRLRMAQLALEWAFSIAEFLVNHFDFAQAVQRVRHVQSLLPRIQFKGLESGGGDRDVFHRRKHGAQVKAKCGMNSHFGLCKLCIVAPLLDLFCLKRSHLLRHLRLFSGQVERI